MPSFWKGLAPAALFAGLAGGSAHAASLNTDVSVTLQSSIVLYCYDNVDIDVSAETYIAALGRNGSRAMPSRARNARARSGRWVVNTGRRNWNRGRYRFRPRVNLDLNGVCAYRAIGGSNGARITVDTLETQLEAAGGSYIDVLRVRARDSDKGGGWRGQYRVAPAELGTGTVRGIDVRLRLDMRNAKEPGTYSSPVDGTFRITVVGNP